MLKKQMKEKCKKAHKKMQGKSNKDGITLIALVITIIVLLILAGVTISTLTGDNSILNQTSVAKEQTLEKGALEQINLAIIASKTNENAYLGSDFDNIVIPQYIKGEGDEYFKEVTNLSCTFSGCTSLITAPDMEMLKYPNKYFMLKE